MYHAHCIAYTDDAFCVFDIKVEMSQREKSSLGPCHVSHPRLSTADLFLAMSIERACIEPWSHPSCTFPLSPFPFLVSASSFQI